MGKTNKNSKQTQTKKRSNVGHKGAIIGLSIALALAGGAAVAAPLVVMSKTKNNTPGVKQWTVSFVVEDHEVTVPSQKVNNNEHATRPNVDDWTENSTKYHIESWTLDGEPFNFANTKITSNITLTAVVKEVQDPTVVKHTVTFNSMGGTEVTQQKVDEGECAVRPQDPRYIGDNKHIFVRWTLNGEEYNFKAPVMNDIELKAEWNEVPETSTTVTFNITKGEGTFDSGLIASQQQIEIGAYLYTGCTIPRVNAAENYEFDCWEDQSGQEIGNVQITGPTQLHARMKKVVQKVSIKLTTQYADLSAFGIVPEITIMGDSSYNDITPGTTYESIKDSLSKATFTMEQAGETSNCPFLYWSKTQPEYSEDMTKLYPAEASGELTDKQTVLYPVFDIMAGENQGAYKLTVKLADGQTVQGSTTVYAPYTEPMFGGEATYSKFGSLTKPCVTEAGKVYEGYYKDQSLTEKWNADDDVDSDGEIWVNMITPVTNFTVTFEDPTSTNEDTYTWDGNKEVLCKYDSEKPVILSNIAPSVYKNANPNPNPAVGYDTDWYFDGWMDKKTGNLVDPNLEIKNPITLIPTFKPKTELVFEIDDSGTTKSIFAAPTAKWSSVAVPQITTSKTGVWFTGWKTTAKGAPKENEYILADDCIINTIKLSGSSSSIGGDQTVHVKPNFEENCHTFSFDSNALIDGTEETTPVVFKETIGEVATGAPISTADTPRETYINSINRPAIPYADNDKISFNNEWQIKGGCFGEEYQTISADTKIPEDITTAQTYTMRPIVKQRTTVKFSIDETMSEIKPWSGSEVLSEITIDPDLAFAKIYHPTVVMKSAYADEHVFSHWSLSLNGDPIDSSYVFPEGKITTVYAVYAEKNVSSTVYFHFSSNDLKNEDFPILNPMPVDPYLKKENTFAVSQSRAQGEEFDPKFSTFAQYPAQRYLSTLLGWSKKDNGTEEDLVDPDTLTVPAGEPLHLYAVFKTNANYVKVTIDTTTEQGIPYIMTGKDHFFVEQGTTSIIDPMKPGKILSKYDVGVKAVGYVSNKWVQSDGSELPAKFDEPLSIKPIFTEASTKVFFSKNGDDSITLSTEQNVKSLPINEKLSTYIDLDTWTVKPAYKEDFVLPTATKPRSQVKKWQILNSTTGKLEDITANTEMNDASITLVPVFETTPGFDVGTEAFFYDGLKGQYAAIKSYNNSTFNVMYEDKTTGTVDKADFNAEIKFGAGMTSIPDNFMAGCVNWNNGYTGTGLVKPLTLPSGIESIGDNFLANCYSFNQPIIAKIKHYETISESSHYGTGTYAFKIGQNFMRNCISFSKYVDLSYDGMTPPMPNYTLYLDIGQGFMYECQSFGTNVDGSCYIDFTGWSEIRDTTQLVPNKAETFYWSLSSSNPNSTIARKGITMYISSTAGATFGDRWIKLNDLAAESGVIPYRGDVIINK